MPTFPEKLTLITDATVEPVTLADAKNYLRLEITNDDSVISDLITTARQQVEADCNRSFISTTWEQRFDNFWNAQTPWKGRPLYQVPYYQLNLFRPPLISVSSITYYDQSGNLQTLDPSQYTVCTGTPGFITSLPSQLFPYTQAGRPEAVRVTFLGGYGTDATHVPSAAKQATRLLVYHWYLNRGVVGEVGPEIAQDYQSLIKQLWWGSYR